MTSQALAPYDTDVARFFERKISDSMRKGAQEVQPLPDADVPALLQRHFASEVTLLTVSGELARRLVDAQVGSMSGGLLVVVAATHAEDEPVLTVLKLEKEEGARASQADVGGKATLSVEYMHDLFLTGRTRVFKVAVFRSRSEASGLCGWVSDPQTRESRIAQFFLQDFLGCRLAEEPQVTTQKFHQLAERFLNDQITDPAVRAQYETALVADLQSNKPSLDPTEFAEQNLEPTHRQPFVAHMREGGVARRFPKNLDLIRGRLRRLQYAFASGVRVTAPAESIEQDLLRVEGLPDGRSRLEVTDTLDQITSRG